MLIESPVLLVTNSVVMAMALSFFVILLWYDIRQPFNFFFSIFLLLVVAWNAGFLLSEAISLLDGIHGFLPSLATGVTQVGFLGSSVAIYALVTVLAGIHTRLYRGTAFAGLLVVLGYNVLLLIQGDPAVVLASPLNTIFYMMFDSVALYIVWRYRRKIQSTGMIVGIILFLIGQGISLLNPASGIPASALSISSIGALLISFSIVQRQIIRPLQEQKSQLEAIHEVGLAITQQIATDEILDEITSQAVAWMDADAAATFLLEGDELNLVAMHNLPATVLHQRKRIGEGLAGVVAETKKSIVMENYARDWEGEEDIPQAHDTFGSVMCAPLVNETGVLGVLMVIAGKQGRLFDNEDGHLLELLCGQAAVALTHDLLFSRERNLTKRLQDAHDQLKTVLESTESPVIAVDPQMRLIFANQAARTLFRLEAGSSDQITPEFLPKGALPDDILQVALSMREQQAFMREVEMENRVYYCHIASLGSSRVEGWVAVLNDVTQLKELDRIKSEMVRMTSHDLKNPLQAALANLDLLKDDIQVLKNQEIELSINNIEKQLNKMQRIIRGILDLERVRLGSQTMESCTPQQLIQNAVEEVADTAREKEIEISTLIQQDVPTIWVDIEQFERALINLLENAVKFTKPGGQVNVRVSQDGTDLIFQIRDTGIGIPKELQSRVFDRFFRGHQPGAEHVSGTGLGLSLVKTVVQTHQGRLWLESTVGEGTSFYIAVPLDSNHRKT